MDNRQHTNKMKIIKKTWNLKPPIRRWGQWKILCKRRGVVKRNEKDFSYWFVNRWKKEVWNCLMSGNYLSTNVYPRQALLYGSPHCGSSCSGISPCFWFHFFHMCRCRPALWCGEVGRNRVRTRKRRAVRVVGEAEIF